MKKTAILLFIMSISIFTWAENSWEPSIGLNLSKLSYAQGTGDYAHGNPNSRVELNWQAGHYFHFRFDELSSVKLGCFYNSLKTSQSYLTNNKEFVSKEVNLAYFQIPFQYEASFKLSKSISLLLTIGHYTQIGIGGSTKLTYRNQTVDIPARFSAINYFYEQDKRHFHYNPIDMGFTIGSGLKIKRFIFSVQYSHGIFNTLPTKEFKLFKHEDEPEFSRFSLEKKRWRYFTFSLSYRLPFLKD